MLSMRHLSKAYYTDTIKTQALQPFDLRIEQGEFVSVVGPSVQEKRLF